MAYSRTQPKEVGRQSPEVGYRPTVAPKWDVLQRDRLAVLDGLELDYRPQPVGSREDRRFVIYIIGVIGFLSILLSMVSPLAGTYLGTPFMFALFTAASVMVGIYTFMTARVWWLAVVYALIGPGTWLFIASPQSANHLPFIGYVFFLLSLGLSGYLADRIATHYASWLAASPQLLGENRKKAKALWEERWQNHYKRGFGFVIGYGLLLILFASTPLIGFKNFLWITLLFALGIVYWTTGFKEIKAIISLCREAIVSWFTYGRFQAIHPDFVEDERQGERGVVIDLIATLFSLFLFLLPIGLLLFVVGEGSLKDSASGGSETLLMTVLILAIFLVAMRAAYTLLRGAYHRHGTVFQHPVLPPGMFQSPGGSWIRRNLLAAVSLFCLFTATVNFTHYAPLVFLYGDSRPWLLAFGRAMDNQPSMTGLMAGLKHYEPPTTAEIIKNLSTGEALLLRKLDPLSRQEYILSKQAADYLRSGPGAWLTLAVDSALLGKVQAVWAILLAVVESLLLPSFIFLTICLAVFGIALPRYAKAVEALKSPVPDWQGYVERLREAPNLLAREHLWLGVHATEDYPVLLHRDILGEHAHLLGDSGSGKTALGMAPLLAQLIELQDSAVVIIDLKGDMAMFQTAQRGAGERFKFFTNEVGKATHVFNPFGLLSSEHISLNQVCEVFLGALGLDHGEGYGRSYYSRIARNVLARAIQEYPDITSFDELRDKVGQAASSLKEAHDAFELVAVVESLAAFAQLNFTATEPDPIAEHAIAMSQVVAKRDVVYFWLPAAIETASVREIAKLALYTLFSSTYQHQRQYQETPRVWVFIDEFQHIASLNFKLVLQQARSMGMGMILANQTDSDLWTDDTNLKDTVQANTRFKQIFSLSNPQEREELSRASGETRYYASGFDPDGELDRMQERLGPRLMENDIIAVSDEKDTSIVLISRGEGYSLLSDN